MACPAVGPTYRAWRRYDFRLAGDAETLDVLFSKLKGLIEETAVQADGTLLPVSPAPVQMRQGCTQSRRRCGRGEPGPGADVAAREPGPRRLGVGLAQS